MTTIFNDVRTDLSGYITVEDEMEENDEDDGTVPDNG
jgi:hypothetical protein